MVKMRIGRGEFNLEVIDTTENFSDSTVSIDRVNLCFMIFCYHFAI